MRQDGRRIAPYLSHIRDRADCQGDQATSTAAAPRKIDFLGTDSAAQRSRRSQGREQAGGASRSRWHSRVFRGRRKNGAEYLTYVLWAVRRMAARPTSARSC